MKEIITIIAMLIMAISPFVFLTGFIQVFSSKSRQSGIKLMTFSVIGFIVGFGMCSSTMSGF
jgi:hypothetical protein